MAFWGKAENIDLQVLASEFGIDFSPTAATIQLIKKIKSSDDYDEEYVKERLKAITASRVQKEKEKQKEKEAERQSVLKKMELEIEFKKAQAASTGRIKTSFDIQNLIQKFDPMLGNRTAALIEKAKNGVLTHQVNARHTRAKKKAVDQQEATSLLENPLSEANDSKETGLEDSVDLEVKNPFLNAEEKFKGLSLLKVKTKTLVSKQKECESLKPLMQEFSDENPDEVDEEMKIPYLDTRLDVFDVEEIVQEKLHEKLGSVDTNRLKRMICQYQDCFSNAPGKSDLVIQDIELTSDQPNLCKPYRNAPRQNGSLKLEIEKMQTG